MEIVVVRETELPGTDREVLEEWSRDLFGAAELEYEWARPDWRVLVREDGALTCHVALCERRALAGDEPVRLGGVGGVMTPRTFQGRGYAKRAMRRAKAFLGENLGVDFGFLFCSERLVPYYARLGWIRIEAPVRFEQPSGSRVWHEEAMYLPLAKITWPPGAVDLCGLPW